MVQVQRRLPATEPVKETYVTLSERNKLPEGGLRGAVHRAIGWSGGFPVPKEMHVNDLLDMVRQGNETDNVEVAYRERIRSPLTGIRAYCVFCSGGSPRGATNCTNTCCSLWPFRTGSNPFFGKLGKPGEGNEEATD